VVRRRNKVLIPTEAVENRIRVIRGHKVMLDKDLAVLYQVRAIALRQQVKRNKERFPPDFLFRLTKTEARRLVSQNVIPSRRSLGGSLPYAFTEQGVAMLSSVLKSRRAAQVNIAVMRAFVRLRELAAVHKHLAAKLDELERKVGNHDERISDIFDVLRGLMETPPGPRRKIGFKP
jgi:aromatic ring-opening dioxygenase LigB subunit